MKLGKSRCNLYVMSLQETLREFGIVFWCNHKMRFNSSNISALRSRAEALGLVAWSVHPHPTSTYTHDGMFRYLGASRHNFHFLRMVEPDAALYVNTFRLHHRLLRPWVSCALDPECLAPPGAQASGISMDELYRLSCLVMNWMYLSTADAILYGWSLHENCSYFKNDLEWLA